MFGKQKQMGRWVAIAVATGLVCVSHVLAQKPVKPPPEPTPAMLNPAIAYVQSQKDGTVDIVVAAADLGSQVVLTESLRKRSRGFGSPAWSADGQFVAFWGKDWDGPYSLPSMLFIARADGSQVTLVRDFATRPGAAALGVSDGLNWTPSGRELVYAPSQCPTVLVAIDAVTGDTRYLHSQQGLDGIWDPALSPDLDAETPGYQGFLAASGYDGSNADGIWFFDIFIVPIEDDEDGYLLPVNPDLFVSITNKPGSSELDASWSPDGRSLAYCDDLYDDPDDRSLAVVDLETGVSRTLSSSTAHFRMGDRPTWTSDGSMIVFRSTEIPLDDLAIIAADGTSPVMNYTATKRLTEKSPAWNPQWDPAGPGGF